MLRQVNQFLCDTAFLPALHCFSAVLAVALCVSVCLSVCHKSVFYQIELVCAVEATLDLSYTVLEGNSGVSKHFGTSL